MNSSQDDNNVQTTCGKIGTNKPTTNHATTKLMKDQTIVIVLGRGSTDLYVEADDVDKRGPNDNCATPLQEQRAAKQRVIYIYIAKTRGECRGFMRLCKAIHFSSVRCVRFV